METLTKFNENHPTIFALPFRNFRIEAHVSNSEGATSGMETDRVIIGHFCVKIV